MTNLILSIFMMLSCEKDTNSIRDNTQLSTTELNEKFIQLIPFKGLFIDSDSVLIGACTTDNLISLIDTISLNYSLTINEPMGLVLTHMDSPPPGYEGEYHHQPDEYIVNYSATIQIDSLNFFFSFSHAGQEIKEYEIIKDSLTLSNIKARSRNNIGLFHDLKIGDSFERIFNYYDKPNYSRNPDLIRKQHRENGVIFTIETDSTKIEDYGKITMIEINRLTKY